MNQSQHFTHGYKKLTPNLNHGKENSSQKCFRGRKHHALLLVELLGPEAGATSATPLQRGGWFDGTKPTQRERQRWERPGVEEALVACMFLIPLLSGASLSPRLPKVRISSQSSPLPFRQTSNFFTHNPGSPKLYSQRSSFSLTVSGVSWNSTGMFMTNQQ